MPHATLPLRLSPRPMPLPPLHLFSLCRRWAMRLAQRLSCHTITGRRGLEGEGWRAVKRTVHGQGSEPFLVRPYLPSCTARPRFITALAKNLVLGIGHMGRFRHCLGRQANRFGLPFTLHQTSSQLTSCRDHHARKHMALLLQSLRGLRQAQTWNAVTQAALPATQQLWASPMH